MTAPLLKQYSPKGLDFYVMGKFLILAVITVAYIVFVWKTDSIPKPVTIYDSENRPLTDLDRECGDLEGQATYRLKHPGSKMFTEVHAKSYWNASGIIFEKGVTYNIQVFNPERATWKDASNDEPPNKGWWPKKGMALWLSELGRFIGFLRAPKKDLFVLIGAIYGKCDDGRTCAAHFPIGNGTDFPAPADGEFCAYANDLPFTYGNNSGSITAQITRK